jgi:hypothetical protein
MIEKLYGSKDCFMMGFLYYFIGWMEAGPAATQLTMR